MEIKRASADEEHFVFGLIAAKPGLGKTTQATTFPRQETLIVSAEDGLLSIKGSDYAYVEVDSYEKILAVIEQTPASAPWAKYLYIDSLTEIYDVLKHELKAKYKPSQNFAKHDDLTDKLLHIIRTARKSKMHVFFTCHTKEDKDGMSLVQNLCFDGKMPELVLKQFDLAFHLDMVEGDDGVAHRALVTSPLVSKIAKRRLSPWMKVELNDIEEPNLYKLTQKLLGNN
jgi:hypothetical protein